MAGRAGELEQATVSRLLQALDRGDSHALDEVFPLVYDELRRIARRQRRRWPRAETLNTTAVVHELYLRIAGPSHVRAESRAHFFALAAKAMRQILSNHARERRAKKRGAGLPAHSLDEWSLLSGAQLAAVEDQADTLVALDVALTRLERVDPRRSRVVECRFYGAMTIEETATALGVAPRTVKRDWAVAQAWLEREMKLLLDF